MKIFKNNLGMYAEAVIDRTCDYYRQKELAIIEKRQIPIKIIRRIDETTIVGKLQAKSFVDYFGVINGHYFEFEVKETDADCFNVNLIKKHQFEYLQYLIKLNIKCFIIVYFSKQSAFYLLDFNWLLNQDTKKIIFAKIKESCTNLAIVYPGILNLIETINNL